MQPRKIPTKKVKTCSRPFKAPRSIIEVQDSDIQDSDVQDSEVQDSESQVKIITETENTRDIEARHRGKTRGRATCNTIHKGNKNDE
jgi:hypothetical protein